MDKIIGHIIYYIYIVISDCYICLFRPNSGLFGSEVDKWAELLLWCKIDRINVLKNHRRKVCIDSQIQAVIQSIFFYIVSRLQCLNFCTLVVYSMIIVKKYEISRSPRFGDIHWNSSFAPIKTAAPCVDGKSLLACQEGLKSPFANLSETLFGEEAFFANENFHVFSLASKLLVRWASSVKRSPGLRREGGHCRLFLYWIWRLKENWDFGGWRSDRF